MDPVALAATALGAGLSAGLALVGATVAALDAVRPPTGTAEPALGAPLYLLAAGTLGGLVLAGVVAWRLLAPLDSTYRRGGLALVSAFATVPIMQLYQPLDAAFGTPALLATAALAAAAAWVLSRRARRIAAT
ncbi:MAG TPA: hypothetical protein VM094_01355 [Gemmatimonadales bacterium]|nr:hypothetical protein [Gemmatimonadales bacterium]